MTIGFCVIILTLIIAFIRLFNISNNNNKEKLHPFECGFNPLLNPQTPFSIQFFKILLIFIIFDIEIIIILPMPLLININKISIVIIISIIVIITLGLIFEWKEGSLQWIK